MAFLGDKRIRQALSYGINTDEIVKAVYFGEGTKQLAHHPPAAWASAPAAQLNAYTYDKAKAEDLIKQAGYAKGSDGFYAKDGKPLAITIVTNQGNKTRETFLQVAVVIEDAFLAIAEQGRHFPVGRFLKQQGPAGGAVVAAVVVVVDVLTGERPFGGLVTEHLVLLRAQFGAQFRANRSGRAHWPAKRRRSTQRS